MIIEAEVASFDISADFYIPEFLWNFWSEACPSHDRNFTPWTSAQPIGLHVYDSLNYELASATNVRRECRNIFVHMQQLAPSELTDTPIWAKLNNTFNSLEREAETAIRSVIQQITTKSRTTTTTAKSPENVPLTLGRQSLQALKKYLLFLRFRNVDVYKELIQRAQRGVLFGRRRRAQSCGPTSPKPASPSSTKSPPLSRSSSITEADEYDEVVNWVLLSESFVKFFEGGTYGENDTHQFNFIYEVIHRRFSAIQEVEICVGAATEPDEFVLNAACFGIVDDGGSAPTYSNPYFHYFFPITPRFVLYLFIDASSSDHCSPQPHFLSREAHISETMDYGNEVAIDVYQRNALLLQHLPRYIIFASSRSMIRTLTYCVERRLPGNADYNKLLGLCRKESVTYTLLVKASIEIIDLTDDVTRVGEAHVAHGSFADVWKGLWTDRQDKGRKKLVALKILRAHIIGNAQERLLKRLRKEISAWHRLQHPRIAQLHGIMQLPYTVAMVSPWCDNGTIVKYLKDKNPGANRLLLLYEIASGIHYLHNRTPPVVHGDLKGCNVLVDSGGHAIITDFGLAQVLEEVSDVITEWPSSIHVGSTRWMAPELMTAMFEDDGTSDGNTDERSQRALPITVFSDVYAFASVCLEVLTGALPYPNRRDPVVTLDVMRGVKPTRGSVWHVDKAETHDLWELMNKCWELYPRTRPTMEEMLKCLSKWSGEDRSEVVGEVDGTP